MDRQLLMVALLVAAVAIPHAGAQPTRDQWDVQLFARVGDPGQPEGIALDRAGNVYVSTNNRGKGGQGPSKVFRYTPDGELEREYVAEGQNLGDTQGLLGIAVDADDRLYVMDSDPPRVLRIDPATGRQETYATIPDLPACGFVPGAGDTPDDGGEPCEPGNEDRRPWPNWPVFDAAGNLYLSDLHQATIWRVPPGGGQAEVWHQDPDYVSIFSLNGMQFDRRDGSLVFVLTGSMQPGSPARGHIYRLAVRPDGTPGQRTLLAATGPAEGPDGLALGASGRIYVALVTTHHILVLEPDGSQAARVPDPAANLRQEVPFDSPASIAFRGTSILVTNHAYFTERPESWAVLDMEVGEAGMALHRPVVPAAATDVPTDPADPADVGSDSDGFTGERSGPGLPASGGGGGLTALGAALLAASCAAAGRTARTRDRVRLR